MAGDVDDVVDAPHHEHVAVVVDVPAVAREVPARVAREVRGHAALVVVPERRQRARGERQAHGDRSLLAGRDEVAVGVQDVDAVPGHGEAGRAGLDRRRLEAAATRHHRPARLGLPPVVDHGAAEHAAGPFVGVGIGALAGQEQRAQRRQRAAAEQRRLGILLADRPDRGRRGEQRRARRAPRSPARTRPRRACRPACPRTGPSSPDEQRRVDDVGVADHPADVRGRPEDLARVHVVDVRHAPRERHRVPAVVAHDALGTAGRARGVEDVERVGRLHRHAPGRLGAGDDRIPVEVAARLQRGRRAAGAAGSRSASGACAASSRAASSSGL